MEAQELYAQASLFQTLGFNVVPLAPEMDRDTGRVLKRPSRQFQGGALKQYLEERQDGALTTKRCPDATMLGLAVGRVSPLRDHTLIVVDFDSLHAFDSMKDRLPFLKNTWLVRTRRGYHVYCLIPNSLSSVKWRSLPEVDIKRNGYVVAPNSHSSALGLHYTFIQGPPQFPMPVVLTSLAPLAPLIRNNDDQPPAIVPNVDHKQIAAPLPWPLLSPKRSSIRYNARGRPAGLSGKGWDLLSKNKWRDYNFRSRSEAEMSVIVALSGQGYELNLIERLFEDHCLKESKFKEHANPKAYLSHSYAKAQQYLVEHGNHNVASYFAALTRYRWTDSGQTPRDRRVLNVLLHIANRLNRFPTLPVSLRELSGWAGLSRSAVQRSLVSLTSLGLIERSPNPNRLKSGSVTFRFPSEKTMESAKCLFAHKSFVDHDRQGVTAITSTAATIDCSDIGHPMWSSRPDGLGERGRLIYDTIKRSPDGLSPTDVVVRTGIPRSTVFHLRKRMIALGLITVRRSLLYAQPLGSPAKGDPALKTSVHLAIEDRHQIGKGRAAAPIEPTTVASRMTPRVSYGELLPLLICFRWRRTSRTSGRYSRHLGLTDHIRLMRGRGPPASRDHCILFGALWWGCIRDSRQTQCNGSVIPFGEKPKEQADDEHHTSHSKTGDCRPASGILERVGKETGRETGRRLLSGEIAGGARPSEKSFGGAYDARKEERRSWESSSSTQVSAVVGGTISETPQSWVSEFTERGRRGVRPLSFPPIKPRLPLYSGGTRMKNTTDVEVKKESAKPTKSRGPKSVWQEVTAGKEELQRIIMLLVEFDERTGRFKRYADQESHWMRKAAGVCSPDELRIFVCDLGSWLYQVTVRITSGSGHLQTTWLHEDGIRAERETLGSEHPVQNIVCLTDLVENGNPVDCPVDLGLETMRADTT